MHWNWIVRCVLLLLVDLNYKISIFIQSSIGVYEWIKWKIHNKIYMMD